MRHLSSWALLISAAVAASQVAMAQPKFELGAGVAGSFYDKKSLTAPSGSVNAGFERGWGASMWIGHNMYPKISGEIRYDMLRNDLMLEGNGTKATFDGDSHAIHYDLHFHLSDRDQRVRPYVIVGGGMKYYRGTGSPRAFQPLSQAAVLTNANEFAGLLTFGFGVKVQLTDNVGLRVDIRDNLTRFPKKVITPNRATGADGWVNNFVPTAGVSLLF